MIKVFVPSDKPLGKARARTVSKGGRTWSYTPTATTREEELIADTWKKLAGYKFGKGIPLKLLLVVIRPFPQSLAKWKRATAFPTSKPDADNYVKLVKDALNGVAWYDDAQVIALQVEKLYPNRSNAFSEPGYYIGVVEVK
jgi:Holliday junction resolvase RusA-like endonuclease